MLTEQHFSLTRAEVKDAILQYLADHDEIKSPKSVIIQLTNFAVSLSDTSKDHEIQVTAFVRPKAVKD